MRSLLSALLVSVLLGPLPQSAAAHPHEFVDTRLSFQTDATGHLAAVQVLWVWDELMSLLTLGDLGLDPDGDGALTAAEQADLSARFSDWPEDFAGDLSLRHAGQPVRLGPPEGMVVDFRDGRFSLDFRRPLVEPLPLRGLALQLQAYDPSYYKFYDVPDLPVLPADLPCTVTRTEADLGAARSLYDRLIGGLTEDEILMQEQEPQVGHAFADMFVLSCPD